MFPPVRQKLQEALGRLEGQLVSPLTTSFFKLAFTDSRVTGAGQRSRRPEHAGGDYQGEGSGCCGVDGDSGECVVSGCDTRVTGQSALVCLTSCGVLIVSSFLFSAEPCVVVA